MNAVVPPDLATARTLGDFEGSLAGANLAPLWPVLGDLVQREPQSRAVPAQWAAKTWEPALRRAGELVSAAQAERRVLVLENPALPGSSCATHSLYAGVQLLLPGERARAHRHTAAALRMVLTGHGGYTTVDGERVAMHPGDFLITPSWSLHDHGNDGEEPLIWLDGLDVPLVNFLQVGFADRGHGECHALTRPAGDALLRYGNGLRPIEFGHARKGATPFVCYPYARTREALAQMSRGGGAHAVHGYKCEYIDPTTGGSALRTMGAYLQLLSPGFQGRSYRCTDAAVFAVLEGSIEVCVAGHVWHAGPRDLFVIPGWTWHAFSAASGEAVLFSFSDRPLQQHLGYLREESAVE